METMKVDQYTEAQEILRVVAQATKGDPFVRSLVRAKLEVLITNVQRNTHGA